VRRPSSYWPLRLIIETKIDPMLSGKSFRTLYKATETGARTV
jgi:hypothetical protein